MARYWNITPSGILHVGAHLAEEASEYEKYGWLPAIWVEAQPDLAKVLNSKLDPTRHKVLEAAIWDVDGVDLSLHIASSSQSSSLLDFGTHAKLYPDITYVSDVKVTTKRLDALIEANEMPNFVNIDIQGVELQAIKSLGKLVQIVDYIYVEVNKSALYENCTKVDELDNFLKNCGFTRKCTRWYLQEGWGDALYVRSTKDIHRNLWRTIASDGIHWIFYLRQYLATLKKIFVKTYNYFRFA